MQELPSTLKSIIAGCWSHFHIISGLLLQQKKKTYNDHSLQTLKYNKMITHFDRQCLGNRMSFQHLDLI